MAPPALSCLNIFWWATLSLSKSCAVTSTFHVGIGCVVLYVCVGLPACHALGHHVFFLLCWFVVLHAFEFMHPLPFCCSDFAVASGSHEVVATSAWLVVAFLLPS